MNPDDALIVSRLRRRARRAYELGRLSAALPCALVVPPLALLALRSCPRSGVHLAVLATLTAVVLVCLRWRGQDFGRAVTPGILIGLAGFAVPWLAISCELCPLAPSPLLFALCGASGAISGLALSAHCLRCGCCSHAHVLSAGTVAGLIAAMGCAPAGVGGLIGMALALTLASVPALVAARSM